MDTGAATLEPAFDFITCESNVLLNQSQAKVSIGERTFEGDGKVRLNLLPQAIFLIGKFQGVPVDEGSVLINGEIPSSLLINGRQVEGFPLTSGYDPTTQEMTIKWRPKSLPIIGVGEDSTEIIRVVFHLYNSVDYFGIGRPDEQSGIKTHAIEHIDLSCDAWKVELKSMHTTRDNFKKLKEEGGYRLTHVGRFERADGTSFVGKEAAERLEALRYFLSFAKGGWCNPICAVGFDGFGNRAWESWSSPRDPWQSPLSWFDQHHSKQLAMLFPEFMKRWENDDWRETLAEIIYWYLNANHSGRGIDAGIILTQAAIERLSYEFLVNDSHLLTGNQFRNRRASDKFRLLFSSLNIPLNIPNETPSLQQLARRIHLQDTPHALTEIRNSLVHPDHGRRSQLHSVYYEAWNLGLWYLEMGILAICGYSGTYGNRLKQRWVGQIEDVPWRE